jgi:hypothetical protein
LGYNYLDLSNIFVGDAISVKAAPK